MAPGLNSVRVYVSDTSDVSIFNRMATDNISKSLSCSWGWSPADPTSDDPIFKEFAAQGQNLFAASGDSGAYSKRSSYVYPADDAYVTSVGGTDLTTNSAGGPWKSETAWSYSGGGISPDRIAIPSYQTTAGVITTANKGSKTLRNAPDVAAEANTDNYICYDGTCAGGWGGTSFAAPRWAGYLALVNQQSVATRQVDSRLYQPDYLHAWPGVELFHRLPRHHQRQQWHVFDRDGLRPGHWLGQPEWHWPDQLSGTVTAGSSHAGMTKDK